jgi:hypothetical protein
LGESVDVIEPVVVSGHPFAVVSGADADEVAGSEGAVG